ncbi:MAG: hypothetical protein N0E44_18150 [Candidatus Thiodiazotropha lotti]|nr:hypothetical protein [Candidatus Thiodiazotropha lotti]MCW4221806.1 hypothetical protein [Candidatus Thiodiazotropha lotti]
MRKIEGTFTATGFSQSIQIGRYNGDFNFTLGGSGWNASIQLQRSYDRHLVETDADADATWHDVTDGVFTAPVDKKGYEPEDKVYYRFSCTHTAGSIPYRLGMGDRQVSR